MNEGKKEKCHKRINQKTFAFVDHLINATLLNNPLVLFQKIPNLMQVKKPVLYLQFQLFVKVMDYSEY